MNVEFAMITAPREEVTSENTVKSLINSGYVGELTVFAEPDSFIPMCSKHFMNEKRLLGFYNHHKALEWLIEHSKSDYICVLLDDMEFSKGFIDKCLKAAEMNKERTAISIVTIEQDLGSGKNNVGWVEHWTGLDSWGGPFLLHKELAKKLIIHPYYQKWYENKAGHENPPMDGIICETLKLMDIPVLAHIPSLADHIGETSTMEHGTLTPQRKGFKYFLNADNLYYEFENRGKKIRMYLNDENIYNEMREEKDFYEHWMLDQIRAMGIIGNYVDIGANVGNHTVYFSKYCPTATIYAFEPNVSSFQMLKENLEINECSNVEAHCMALGNEKGFVISRVPDQNKKGTALVEPAPSGIPLMRLDDFHKSHIDLIKIDVEGYELSVLSGAMETIKNDKPEIFIEIWDEFTLDQVQQMLDVHGYRLIERYNHAPTYHFSASNTIRITYTKPL